MSKTYKIVICGPLKGGKSSLANYLGGATEVIGHPNFKYTPTVGVRILECERPVGMSGSKVNVELWDVSGNMDYEACWPAIAKDTHGVLLVYNPEIPTHEAELTTWYDQLVKGTGVSEDQILVLAHRTDPKPAPRPRLPPKLSKVHSAATNFGSAQQVASTFEDLLRAAVDSQSRNDKK